MTLPEALTVHVAAGRIRSAWLLGMLYVDTREAEFLAEHPDGAVPARFRWSGPQFAGHRSPHPYAMPVDDPATNGCLLALLREALPLCGIEIRAPSSRGGGVWQVRIIPPHGDVRIYTSPTEHVALSDALIALAESP